VETAFNIIVGFALLALGGEAVVRGAVGVARRLGVSELVIGLTLVGFGTSAPELLTSVNAALSGSPGIAIGNVVGSNISNVLLVFALVAIARPFTVEPRAVRRDGVLMALATMLCAAIGAGLGGFGQWTGFAFVSLLIVYITVTLHIESRNSPSAALHKAEGSLHDPVPSRLFVSLFIAVAGIALLGFGADFLVQGAIALARLAGLSEAVIGLTIVAVGTSLPELVATLAAALKGRGAVAFGNIVGSNIYNILGILGLTAMIKPIAVPPDIVARDWTALIGSAVLLLIVAGREGRATRLEGVVLLACYALYCWLLLPR